MVPARGKIDSKVEELLEFIWAEREAGRSSISKLLSIEEVVEAGANAQTLSGMAQEGLVMLEADKVELTARGEELSREAIRSHRLAERLLTDVLDVDPGEAERTACDFEHSLSPAVAESICTLLAHPPTCPHGHEIPRGKCCEKMGATIKPLVMPLGSLDIGEAGRIIFILSGSHARLDRLGSMGIVPGSIIKLHQKRPAFVINIGETTLALDPEIVDEIFVKKAGSYF